MTTSMKRETLKQKVERLEREVEALKRQRPIQQPFRDSELDLKFMEYIRKQQEQQWPRFPQVWCGAHTIADQNVCSVTG